MKQSSGPHTSELHIVLFGTDGGPSCLKSFWVDLRNKMKCRATLIIRVSDRDMVLKSEPDMLLDVQGDTNIYHISEHAFKRHGFRLRQPSFLRGVMVSGAVMISHLAGAILISMNSDVPRLSLDTITNHTLMGFRLTDIPAWKRRSKHTKSVMSSRPRMLFRMAEYVDKPEELWHSRAWDHPSE